MPIIPNKLHFLWVGKLPPAHYMKNMFDWANQNLNYQVYIWTELKLFHGFSELVKDSFYKHPAFPETDKYQIDTLETERGHVLNFSRGEHPIARIYMNFTSTLEALNNPMILAEEWGSWKNFGAVADILRCWIGYDSGGIIMDLDTYPIGVPIPLDINAPHGILFSQVPSVSQSAIPLPWYYGMCSKE